MALPNTPLMGLGCHTCRQHALRSFIANIAGSQAGPLSRRAFITAPRRSNEARERIQHDAFALNEINDIGSTSRSTTSPSSGRRANRRRTLVDRPKRPWAQIRSRKPDEDGDASDELMSMSNASQTTSQVAREDAQQPPEEEGEAPAQSESLPWYLQHQSQTTPSSPSSPMLARQRLPDLPTNPPPLLSPLLSHISINLGLDDLSLLDLRTLDPPPALGSNLLMILGTARSEKHLHVSADRLCRWLRSEPHFLTPYADGLLGRNELKLKMRRQMKKSRLMSAVGAKGTGEEGEMEEGIRTGWVCVNVGKVEGGELESTGTGEQEEKVVGFGVDEKGGCRIVVQMLTEEKRGELDIEKLWLGILNRNQKEREMLEEKEKAEAEAVEAEAAGLGNSDKDDGVRKTPDMAVIESSEGTMQSDLGMAR